MVVSDIPRVKANNWGFNISMNTVGNMISDDNWLPKYTDKIAATGTELTKTPKKIPIEHVIAIEEIPIIRESNVLFK